MVIGQKARGSPGFRLDDLPSTSGRLDLLLRCARAALLVSHGVRRDVVVYLVLLGEPERPRVIKVDGAAAQFLRPDERAWAVLAQKALAKADLRAATDPSPGFGPPTRGVSVAEGGLEVALTDVGERSCFVLDETAALDVRDAPLGPAGTLDCTFVLGDHLGLAAALDESLVTRMHVGPVILHADDTIAVLHNELDRRR